MLETAELKTFMAKGKSKKDKFRNEVLKDYWVCCVSREVSLLGRKENPASGVSEIKNQSAACRAWTNSDSGIKPAKSNLASPLASTHLLTALASDPSPRI